MMTRMSGAAEAKSRQLHGYILGRCWANSSQDQRLRVRRSRNFGLKEIYRAVDPVAAEAALTAFEASPWGRKYAAIGPSWRRAWSEVVPFYAFPADVRRMLYTTNPIEAHPFQGLAGPRRDELSSLDRSGFRSLL